MRSRSLTNALFLCASVFFIALPVAAKDDWIRVQSKNFHLIGNASEKDIRAVATKLEQFRESFRLIFPGMKVNSPTPTTVIVFKSNSSYRPFKPKRGDKIDENVAGYFQAGEDVNYITLSTEGENEDTFGTIFHEYVHFMLDTSIGKANIPPWFNEGLAEYYQTYRIEEDQKIILGRVQAGHLYLLSQTKLIPFRQFFEVDSYSLLGTGGHSRSIFYAQAWALIHYLIQGNGGNNVKELERFLSLVLKDVPPETAFKQAFNKDYATMEKELTAYINKSKYTNSLFTLPNKLVFDTQMTVSPMDEATSSAYLGDLLFHTRNYTDADIQLKKTLALQPDNLMANTSLGLVRMRQGNFPEAKRYLERAIALDSKSGYAQYYYAYILSRENVDEFGYVQSYPAETAAKMRAALTKAVELAPNFAESYRLLGFLAMITGNDLDNALKYINRGLAIHPGNPDYLMLAAKIKMRQEKFDEARTIAEKVARTTDKKEVRSEAEGLLNSIQQISASKAAYDKQLAEAKSEFDAANRKLNIGVSKPPVILKRKDMTDEEFKQVERDQMNIGLNRVLPSLQPGEERVMGRIDRVHCPSSNVRFELSSAGAKFTFSAINFQSLHMSSYKEGATAFTIGCSANLSKENVVLTYRKLETPEAGVHGRVLAIAFVPLDFKLMTAAELADARLVIVEGGPPTDIARNAREAETDEVDFEKQRREMMIEGLRNALRQPLPGEVRLVGTIDKVECSGSTMSAIIGGAPSGPMKVKIGSPSELKLVVYVQDAGDIQFGCGASLPNVKAVITYLPSTEKKPKYVGDLKSVELVPQSFTLQ